MTDATIVAILALVASNLIVGIAAAVKTAQRLSTLEARLPDRANERVARIETLMEMHNMRLDRLEEPRGPSHT
jgi:hypothetical protein